MTLRKSKLIFLKAAIAVSLVLALGCDSSGPEFASGETRLIDGTLELDEVSESHFFAVTKSGTVGIEATTFIVTVTETGEVIEDATLGVSVCGPDPENETSCRLTFSQVLEQGESYSVYFREGVFCVTTLRPPGQPSATETVVNYLLTLSGAFS